MQLRRLRILFLASYFPKPGNALMGTWALEQAQALKHAGSDILVVSFTSWVPNQLAMSQGAKAYANCPLNFTWDNNLKTLYPRWLYYPIYPVKSWMYTNPQPYLSMALLSSKRRLETIIKEFCPDIIFCHHSLPNGWIASQIASRFDVPLITLDHDFDEVADCRKYQKRKAAMQTVVNQAWAMLAVSERMKQDIQSIFHNPKRLITHSIGVNIPPPQILEHPRPAELENKIIVLSCALFAERKGIPSLIEAFCRISGKYPTAILRIIGGGADEERVRATIAKYDKNQRVQVLGKKQHSEVIQEMSWADCFALTSWDEPLGAVYLEAMAAGKPIICCDDGGMNDLIKAGVHGYTVPPKNIEKTVEALEKLLKDKVKRLEMGQHAKKLIADKMSWGSKAMELLDLFDQAASDYKSHG